MEPRFDHSAQTDRRKRGRARGGLHLGLEEPPTVLAKVNRTDERSVRLGQREQVRPVRHASIIHGFHAYVSPIVSSHVDRLLAIRDRVLIATDDVTLRLSFVSANHLARARGCFYSRRTLRRIISETIPALFFC